MIKNFALSNGIWELQKANVPLSDGYVGRMICFVAIDPPNQFQIPNSGYPRSRS